MLLAVLCGCTHSHVLSRPPDAASVEHFNRAAREARVAIHRTNGDSVAVRGAAISATFVSWHDSASGRTVQLPLAEVRELRFRNLNRAFGQGLLIGGIIGGSLGAVVFAGVAGNCQGTTCSVESRLPVFLVALPPMLLGSLIGSSVGGGERFTAPPGPP